MGSKTGNVKTIVSMTNQFRGTRQCREGDRNVHLTSSNLKPYDHQQLIELKFRFRSATLHSSQQIKMQARAEGFFYL